MCGQNIFDGPAFVRVVKDCGAEFVRAQLACGLDIKSATKCPAACKTFLPKLATASPECVIAVDLMDSSVVHDKIADKLFKLCTGV